MIIIKGMDGRMDGWVMDDGWRYISFRWGGVSFDLANYLELLAKYQYLNMLPETV